MSEDVVTRDSSSLQNALPAVSSPTNKVGMTIYWMVVTLLLAGASAFAMSQMISEMFSFMSFAVSLTALLPVIGGAEERAKTNRQSIAWWAGGFGCLAVGLAIAAMYYGQ